MYILKLVNMDLAFITNIRGSQLLIIALVILLLFGTKRLPELAKGFGKAIREFRKSAFEVEKDFRNAMEDAPNTQTNQEGLSPIPVSTDERIQK